MLPTAVVDTFAFSLPLCTITLVNYRLCIMQLNLNLSAFHKYLKSENSILDGRKKSRE